MFNMTRQPRVVPSFVLFLVILFFSITFITTQAHAKIRTIDLTGYWKVDEEPVLNVGVPQPITKIVDSSGLDVTGTLVGNPLSIKGRVGKAFELNGVDQYIKIKDNTAYGSGSLTISAWIKIYQW